MIVEDGCEEFAGDNQYNFEYDDFDRNIIDSDELEKCVTNEPTVATPFPTVLKQVLEVNDKEQHQCLQNDLMHHLYINFLTIRTFTEI